MAKTEMTIKKQTAQLQMQMEQKKTVVEMSNLSNKMPLINVDSELSLNISEIE